MQHKSHNAQCTMKVAVGSGQWTVGSGFDFAFTFFKKK